jgi:hypothetical protein
MNTGGTEEEYRQTCVQLIGHQVKDLFDSILLERSISAQTLKHQARFNVGPMNAFQWDICESLLLKQ